MSDLSIAWSRVVADHATSPEGEDSLLAEALRRRGHVVSLACWDGPEIDWHAADAVIVGSTWDYWDRRDDFVEWASLVAEGTRLFPDADVVRWNTHKSYLLELEDRGVPVVPTAWLGAGDRVALAALAEDRGWRRVVAKPAVGAGGAGLLVATEPSRHQDAFQALVDAGDTLVQPLLEGVRLHGEVSVVVIDGRCSHAVARPTAVEAHRVHAHLGGSVEPIDLDPERTSLAEWVVAATEAEPVVARVDLVPDDVGTWMVAELELVEPALYLDTSPGAADRLADAYHARLRHDPAGPTKGRP